MSFGTANPLGPHRNVGTSPSIRSPHNEQSARRAREAIADLLQSKTRKRRKVTQTAPAEPLPFYYRQTHRPIVCLAFVLPLVMLYETCSILLANEAVRSGVDQWISGSLSAVGIGQVVILPVIVTGIMIVWHHRNEDALTFNPIVLAGMLIESSLLGLILYWLAKAAYFLAMASLPESSAVISAAENVDWLVASVSVLGSGIYEETFFRIILLLPMIAWGTWLTSNRELGVTSGIIFCSLIFALLHYSLFNPAGHHFEVSSFVFRFGASIVFCNLFLFRGFGIAVGSHVAYDLLTQL